MVTAGLAPQKAQLLTNLLHLREQCSIKWTCLCVCDFGQKNAVLFVSVCHDIWYEVISLKEMQYAIQLR